MLKKILIAIVVAITAFTFAPTGGDIAALKAKGRNLLRKPGPLTERESASQFIKRHARKIVKLTPVSSANRGGTGFAVSSPSGNTYTVTNNHVCGAAEDGKMAARWDDGTSVILTVIETDPDHDLCLLTPLPKTDGLVVSDTELDLYDPVFVIGHPRLNPVTYAEGYITARENIGLVNETFETRDACEKAGNKWEEFPTIFGVVQVCIKEYDAIETSVVIYPGNSGSPVFNQDGEIAGVIFVGDGATNYGGYVPLTYLKRLIAKY